MNSPTEYMNVILIDDDKDLIQALQQALELEDIQVQCFRNPAKALKKITDDFDGAIITDVRMPEMDGLNLFKKIQMIDPEIPVIVITGHADVPMILSSIKEGVFDFLAKPVSTEQLITSAIRGCKTRSLVLENRRLKDLAQLVTQTDVLIGESKPMVHLREIIAQIAKADVDILIEGETGTGKQTVARMIHELSARSQFPFVDVNCASIPIDTASEELFGRLRHEPTKLGHRRKGKLEAADRGILYLNKLESAPLDLQGTLLELVDQDENKSKSSLNERPFDVRIIASSLEDLQTHVSSQKFRPDLYFKLNTFKITMPSLRDRREDIPFLFAHFLKEASEKFKKKIPTIKMDARKHLYEYDWPGNVQELKNYAQTIVLGITHPTDNMGLANLSLPERVEHFEGAIIRSALKQAMGSVPKTIEILNIPRKTFYDKVKRHSIDLKRYRV